VYLNLTLVFVILILRFLDCFFAKHYRFLTYVDILSSSLIHKLVVQSSDSEKLIFTQYLVSHWRRGWVLNKKWYRLHLTDKDASLPRDKFSDLISPYTANTQYRKFEINIPRKGTARLQSQFLHSCFCERFIYHSSDRSAYSAACRKIGVSSLGKYRSLTDTWMWKLGLRLHAIPFLGIQKFKFLCTVEGTTIRPYLLTYTYLHHKM
jgi:hypothetical protein